MILVSCCSCLCPNNWSQVLSREWRCSWSSADRRCCNYIWAINNFIACWGASYIRDLTVYAITDVAISYVGGGCTIICCRFHTYPGTAEFCFFYYCAVLWCAQIIEYIMARWLYSFVGKLHTPSLSSLYGCSWKYCTSKMLVRHILSRLKQFYQSSFMQYLVIVRISVLYFIIIVKSEVWPICHCLGLCHKAMVCAVFQYSGDLTSHLNVIKTTDISYVGLTNWSVRHKGCCYFTCST